MTITQFDKLKDLFSKMDSIEGTTEGGRHFKMVTSGDVRDVLKTQIIHNNEAFEPLVRISDFIGKNILSFINKIDSSFFNRLGNFTRTKRKEVELIGNREGEKFTASVSINNDWHVGNYCYRGGINSLSLNDKVPNHINVTQRHNWLYLYYQKKENWIDILIFDIKQNFYQCCGESIRGRYNYCHTCGKKQEVNGVVIETITTKELLTKLS